MSNLFIINEILTNKYNVEVLDIISIFTIICGISIIVTKNPIISILYLIGLFGGVSSYLILLGLSFIGLAYLIIYIGAVSILFLFILMLINIRTSELQNNNTNSIPLALITLIFLSYAIFQVLPYSIAVLNNFFININTVIHNMSFHKSAGNLVQKDLFINNNDIYFASSNDWNGNLIDVNNISNIGTIIYTSYNIWLIITGFILLLAMVGAIIITLKKTKRRD